MLVVSKIVTLVKEYDYEMKDIIQVHTLDGYIGKCFKYVLSSDYFIGYEFTTVNYIFQKINDFLTLLNHFCENGGIVSLINNQALLVNKRIYSTINILYNNNETYSLDISTMFEEIVKDTDIYILANNSVLDIINYISEVLNNERKKRVK